MVASPVSSNLAYTSSVMAEFKKFGSISHGTLRTEDLLETFLDEAKDVYPNWEEANVHTGNDSIIQEVDKVLEVLNLVGDDDMSTAFYASDWAAEAVNDLMDKINEQDDMPPFVSFRTHEGDASDFGYWFEHDSFEDAVQDGEVVKVEELPEDLKAFKAEHDGVQYIAVISDHGNIELYSAYDGQHLYGVV